MRNVCRVPWTLRGNRTKHVFQSKFAIPETHAGDLRRRELRDRSIRWVPIFSARSIKAQLDIVHFLSSILRLESNPSSASDPPGHSAVYLQNAFQGKILRRSVQSAIWKLLASAFLCGQQLTEDTTMQNLGCSKKEKVQSSSSISEKERKKGIKYERGYHGLRG